MPIVFAAFVGVVLLFVVYAAIVVMWIVVFAVQGIAYMIESFFRFITRSPRST